ncbi:DEAD/DEAH box helicase [Actinomyces naeslundii]|uniref:RNA helicase n=2 Tax=Actinomyces naeslundii TaxID=1655 RepID=J3ADH1_ACTNH|nr:DEAD/DEAH box helicase [Actinomyces naeslundii]EJN86053.1 DEAD/DEAH box helicase [Actinomyces naeslundii str. Howell 279]OMG38513.1 DEAD/DEAH box helicase [Actinomyces naeslundii]QQC20106.1 DEAD/DEAH box helicase [Actinomyces naeslundii]
MTTSSSTAPGSSDGAQSSDSNGPLSLDALFSAELSGGRPADANRDDETVAAPHHSDDSAPSPEDFATPASSDSPEDPEDVDHEDEADDVDRDRPEADPEDEADDSDEDDGVDIDEDEVDGHTPFIDSDADSNDHQQDDERPKSPRNRDKGGMKADHEDEEITFADLGLPRDLLKAVTDMGFVTPTAIQKEAIPVLLAGRDVVGVAQTGTGKTAAFGLPLLDAVDSRDGVVQALVLAPTRELALQSAEAITDMASRSRGLDVVAVYGGAPYGPQIGALKGGAQVVVGTPGRVIDLIDKGALQLDDVRYFVLDEADEMLRMGFAEDVETIAESLPTERRTALFSATMPPAIQAVARQHLHEPVQVEVSRPASTVATVHQTYAVVPFRHKIGAVSRVLAVTDAEAAIVFVRTKSTAEDVAIELAGRGIQAAAISGDVPQRERERLVERLRAGTLDVLVATDVAARGLDVDRIGLVVNFDVPREAEAYVHRIGRTGRAGRHGEAVTFLTPKEKGKLRQIERLTGSRLEEITLPSPADVSEHRARKLLSKAATRHERGRLDMYLPLVSDSARDLDIDVEELAATLLALAVGDEGPRRREDRGGERPQRARREENLDSEGTFLSASFEGGREKNRHGERGDRGEGRRSATRSGRREHEGPGTVYRIEVGHRDRVLPGAIVGALANEGGIEGSDIGKIDILQSFSLVTIYADLSPEQLSVMGRATFAGRELRIRPDEGPGHGWSGPNSGERRPKRRDWDDRGERGERRDRSERGFRPRRDDGDRGWKDRDGRGGRGGYDRGDRRWEERRGDRDGFRGREDRGGRGYGRDGYRGDRGSDRGNGRGYGERNQNRFGGNRGGFRGGRGDR